MKPSIIFRADANDQIGLGHLVRCMALAHMLKEHFEIDFWVMQASAPARRLLAEADFSHHTINTEQEFLAGITADDIVVLDGYYFDTAYQQRIKNRGALLVCIDDLHDQRFVADIIINHAPGIRDDDYKAANYTQYLLGPDYALLRPEFLQAAKHRRIPTAPHRLFICFGGLDPLNLTEKVLALALDEPKFEQIIVVTGGAYAHRSAMNALCDQTNGRAVHHHQVDASRMLQLMLSATIGIVPASGILFEALAASLRVIAGHYVDNQRLLYAGFKSLGCIIPADDFSPERIKEGFQQALALNSAPPVVIDGLSGQRIYQSIIQQHYSHLPVE